MKQQYQCPPGLLPSPAPPNPPNVPVPGPPAPLDEPGAPVPSPATPGFPGAQKAGTPPGPRYCPPVGVTPPPC